MADKVSKVILPVKSGDNIELKEFDIRDADIADTFNALGLYVDSDGYTCQALFGETKD